MFKNRIDEIDALKVAIAEQRPLLPQEKIQLKEYFRIGLTYTSNALEGNSLTETETKIILEDGITIGGKSVRDHLEAIGHSKAFDVMYQLAAGATIVERDIFELHRLFYQAIDDANAGKYRTVNVFISGSGHVFPAPEAVPGLMKTFIAQIPEQRRVLRLPSGFAKN